MSENGDVQEWHARVLENQGLVEKVMRNHCVPRCYWDDVKQEGEIGLISAVRNFDEKRGTRFSTYAWACIRNQVLRAVTAKSLSGYSQPSLNKQQFVPGEELDSLSMRSRLSGESLDEIFDSELEQEDFLEHALERLTTRMQEIVRMRYGLHPYGRKMSCAEVAERLHISSVRVSELTKHALRILQEYAKNVC